MATATPFENYPVQSGGSSSALETPTLSITQTQGTFLVSWPASAIDWVLEDALYLQPPVLWNRVPSQLYQTNGPKVCVWVPALEENRFYRLRKIGPGSFGLTGHWRMDEGQGQIADDANGSGNAMFFTNATWSAGRIGPGALRFNGGSPLSAGSQGWISNSNYQVLPLAGQPFALSLWFNVERLTNGWRGIVGNDHNGANGWQVALNVIGPGTNDIIFAGTGLGASLSVTGRTLLLPGQWHQLTVTHDGAEGRLYLDSCLLAEGSGSLVSNDGPIYVGGGVGNYDSFWGRIDDVRTYTTAFTPEQVSRTGQWHFSENAGSFVEDSSVHGHHAGVTDPMAWVPGKDGSGIELSSGRVIIPNDDYAILPPTGQPFSISFWLRPGPLPDGPNGLMSCAEGTINGWHLILEQDSDQTWLHFTSTNCGGTMDLKTLVALTNGAWAKFDFTYNGGIGTVYMNGRKVHAETGGIQGGRAPLTVGAVSGAINFNGVIDELNIFRRERAASEIGPVAFAISETVFVNSTTNILLQGFGPAGKTLSYSILPSPIPTKGFVANGAGSSIVTYQAGASKGPDAFAYAVSDGEFTSAPETVALSVVQPHWLSASSNATEELDGTNPERAWAAGSVSALEAIWRTNNYYDCFFYAPGEYRTRGFKYLERTTANPGCKHIGSGSAGPSQTTLKLVDTWGAWTEGLMFGHAYPGMSCDGLEVRHMKLDCNAANNPKYARGEPMWLRIPLTTTARVDSVTLNWSDRPVVPWNVAFWMGRAAEFSLCTRPATNASLTNCTALISTGRVDVISLGIETDELFLQLDRRRPGVDFYGLTEVSVAGAAVSLPSATVPGGGESRLDAEHSIMAFVDDNPATSWASGPESQVEIVLPLARGTALSQVNLRWNCKTLETDGRLGPAASYLIRARDESTGQFYDVPFVRHDRTPAGWQTNTFGTADSTNVIVTDRLAIVLLAREAGIDHYSLREVTLQNRAAPVSLRLPTAQSALDWVTYHSALRAFDRDTNTQWASGFQGMVGAMQVRGNNVKLIDLQVVGFGTKLGLECFPMSVRTPYGNVLIEDCIFKEPAISNTDGLTTVAVIGETTTPTNAIVRRCAVSGMKPYFTYSQGYSAVRVENCLVDNCGAGVYFEPDLSLDDIGPVLVRSNRFVNVNNGVYLFIHAGRQFDSMTCLDNEIALTGANGWGFAVCDTCETGPSGTIRSVTALNNLIRYVDWSLRPAGGDGGLHYSDIQNAVFGNNVVHLGTPHSLRVRQCPSGIIPPPMPPEECDSLPPPIGPTTNPPCLDIPPAGYRRGWFNNRTLSGDLLPVRFSNSGVDGNASQQQWAE